MSQGSYSALNMLGKLIPFSHVPFQQTVIYGKNLQCIGQTSQWDEVFIDGSTKDGKFIAYYIKDNNILGVLGQNRSGDILVLYEAMNQNKLPPANEIKDNTCSVDDIKKQLKLNKNGARCRREKQCKKK